MMKWMKKLSKFPRARPYWPLFLGVFGLAGFFWIGFGRFNLMKKNGMIQSKTQVIKPAEQDFQKYGDARCNDGTPFAFILEQPTTPTDIWIIHLQGGGMCDDNAFDCRDRTASLITTLSERDGELLIGGKKEGYFSPDPKKNPEFYNANKVFAHYCSSDLWTGNTDVKRPTKGSTTGWYFSGRKNVEAMLSILAEKYGLTDSAEARVLFGGSSAGCIGVNANADQIKRSLPITAKSGRLKVASDACFTPEYDNPEHPFGYSEDSMTTVMRKAFAFWGGYANPLCEDDQTAQGQDPSVCLAGKNLFKYVSDCTVGLCLPNIVQNSSIDTFLTTSHGINPRNPNDLDLKEFREMMIDGFNSADIKWLFSGGDKTYHGLLTDDDMFSYGPKNGPTFGELLIDFWNDGKAKKIIFGNP